jgi:hypothetical protein
MAKILPPKKKKKKKKNEERKGNKSSFFSLQFKKGGNKPKTKVMG